VQTGLVQVMHKGSIVEQATHRPDPPTRYWVAGQVAHQVKSVVFVVKHPVAAIMHYVPPY